VKGAPKVLTALAGLLLLEVVGLVLGLRVLSPHSTGRQIGYSDLTSLLSTKQVTTAVLKDQDARLELTTRSGRAFLAYPTSGSTGPVLLQQLTNAKVPTRVDQQTGKRIVALVTQFLLPLLLLATVFGLITLLARGGGGQVKELFAFSRLGARRATTSTNTLRFTDVAAAGEAVVELSEVRDYLKDPSRFAAMGALPPKGVLLYGPPGCGKTLLAKALAGETGVPFFFISGSEFVESLVGVGAARVRDLFLQARAVAPAIVFIDELDAAGRRRGAGVGGGNDEREQTLNEMLVQMDGFAPTLGVVVIAATNRPDILDPALLRPGRFDRHVALEPPDVAGRLEILQLHAHQRPLDASADLAQVAKTTPGFSGADLANVLNEAALLAVRSKATRIGPAELDEAVQRVMNGPKRRGRILTEKEVRRLAYHEAVAGAVDYPAQITRVSIVARGRNAAHTDLLPQTDRTVLTRSELEAELAIAMAGIAAEELATGEPSTAGEGDVERATDMARRYAGQYGMSTDVGRLRVLRKDTEAYLGRDMTSLDTMSSQTLQSVDTAISGLLEAAEQRALKVLVDRRTHLDRVAEALVEHETLDEADLLALLAQPARNRPRTRPGAGSRSS
jgi:cell division protease FtsH